jgi:alpha-tubulin suppressor-like RCC1 family protein
MKIKFLSLCLVLVPLFSFAQQQGSGGFSLGGFFNAIQGKIDAVANGLNPMTSGTPITRSTPQEWIASNALAVGSHHVLYLTKKGKVYGWGSNHLGQLAQGKSSGKSPTGQEVVNYTAANFAKPTLIPIDGVIAVYAAGRASYALKADGSVWSWGDSRYAGRGSYQEGSIDIVPAKIEGLPPIAKLAPFTRGVYAYDVNGKVWVWGNSDQASMLQGTEFGSAESGTPIASRLGSPIDVRASSFGNTTYLLATDGSLWNPSDMKNVMSPLKFSTIFGESSYSEGAYYARTIDGKIYQWKDGGAEKFSNGTSRHSMNLIERVGEPVEVARGNGFAVFLQPDGTLLVWGGVPAYGNGFAPFLTGMTSAAQIPQPVKFNEKIVSIKGHLLGIFIITESGAVYKHNAIFGEEISMSKGRGDGRSFTELLRPEQLPD